MILGRIIYGMGGENLTITTSAFIGQWFKGKELAFALGVDISAARIAATVNDATQPMIYESSGKTLHTGYWIGFVVAIYSILCAIVASIIDFVADKKEKKDTLVEGQIEQKDESEEVHIRDVLDFTLPYWLVTGNCVFFYMSYFSLMNVLSELMHVRYAISIVNCGFLMVQ
jgi:MFS family permease